MYSTTSTGNKDSERYGKHGLLVLEARVDSSSGQAVALIQQFETKAYAETMAKAQKAVGSALDQMRDAIAEACEGWRTIQDQQELDPRHFGNVGTPHAEGEPHVRGRQIT